MGMHGLSCLLLAVDCIDVLLDVDCVSLLSSGPELKDGLELLLDLQDAWESGIDSGTGFSASCWTAGKSFMAVR